MKLSQSFLMIIVLLIWVALYVGKVYFDISHLDVVEESYRDMAFGFPFPFYFERWTIGSELMHKNVMFSMSSALIDLSIITGSSLLLGILFGKKDVKRNEGI